MAKPKQLDSLGPAECAHRTGLTVRALRIYERQGLIAPARSAKGWRRYGPKELARLNIIVTLKAFGLTLAQIRGVLATTPPPLARVLRLQLEAWRTRKAAAERGLALIQAALTRIESKRPLSVEALCDLARNMDMSDHQVVTRELMNETVTPAEERAYVTWWAARPPNEAIAMREYSGAMRVLFRSLADVMEAKADPSAAEVQAVVDQWNANALRYRLRNVMLELLEWDASIARKILDVGERTVSRTAASGAAASNHGLWDYFTAAVRASAWHQALMQIVDEAVTLMERKMAPSSTSAKALAQRVAQICAKHSLGEPVTYARWSSAMQHDDQRKAAWRYLADAL